MSDSVHNDQRHAGETASSPVTQSAPAAQSLTDASRSITSSRSHHEIIERAVDAFRALSGAEFVQFIDVLVPVGHPVPGTIVKPVSGHGRALGRFEIVLRQGADSLDACVDETLDLLATVTGTALARTAADPPPALSDRRSTPRGDRRRMDRDFIDHARNGQVGCIVLRLVGPDPTSEAGRDELIAMSTMIDDVIRANDVSYLSAPGEISVLLPGASRAETAMAADRIRQHLVAIWADAAGRADTRTGPLVLFGGVAAGRHEDPQRLAERALEALDEAECLGPNAVVTDLGA